LSEQAVRGDGLAEMAFKSLQMAAQLIIYSIRTIVLLIAIALPWLIRGACVAIPGYAVVTAFPALHIAFGGDVAALLPAAAFTLFPLAAILTALASGGSPDSRWWGGLLAGGGIILAVKALAQQFTVTTLHAACAIALAVIVFALIINNEEGQDEQGKWEDTAADNRCAAPGIHCIPQL